MNRTINVNNLCPSLMDPEKMTKNLFLLLDDWKHLSIPDGDLSVVFLNNQTIAELHERFLNDDTPTDVITFPNDSDMDFAGEICVSAEQAYLYSKQHQQNFREELVLYLVHGWLHLGGINDKTSKEASTMRMHEKQLINWLSQQSISLNFQYHP